MAVPLAAVMKALTDVPSAARIVVLDAARNGAFGKAGGQPVSDGLALMGVPPGVLLAYSAAPGVYAPEFDGTNSPYANALTTLIANRGSISSKSSRASACRSMRRPRGCRPRG